MSWKRREACIAAPFLQFNLSPVLTVHPQRRILIRAPFPCLTTITICWSGFRGGLKRDRYQETFRGCLVQTVVWQGQLHLYIEIFFLSGVLEGSSVFSGRFSSLCLFFSSFIHWANGRNNKGIEKPGVWISRQVGIPWCRSVRWQGYVPPCSCCLLPSNAPAVPWSEPPPWFKDHLTQKACSSSPVHWPSHPVRWVQVATVGLPQPSLTCVCGSSLLWREEQSMPCSLARAHLGTGLLCATVSVGSATTF